MMVPHSLTHDIWKSLMVSGHAIPASSLVSLFSMQLSQTRSLCPPLNFSGGVNCLGC
jgi:hypothetical protein